MQLLRIAVDAMHTCGLAMAVQSLATGLLGALHMRTVQAPQGLLCVPALMLCHAPCSTEQTSRGLGGITFNTAHEETS